MENDIGRGFVTQTEINEFIEYNRTILNCYYLFPNVGVPEDKFDEVPTKELTDELSHPAGCKCCNFRRKTIIADKLIPMDDFGNQEGTYEYIRREPDYANFIVPDTNSEQSQQQDPRMIHIEYMQPVETEESEESADVEIIEAEEEESEEEESDQE